MEYAKKPVRRNAAKLKSAETHHTPKLPGHTGQAKARIIQAFMMRPAQAQQQVTHPIRWASTLRQQEEQLLHKKIAAVQGNLQSLTQKYSPEELKAAREREGGNTLPDRPPLKPQSMTDWVTVMRFQAAQMEGRWVNSREQEQFSQLQRQVSQTLLQRYRADRRPPEARHAEYAMHLSALQRHPLSAPVGVFFMNHVPSAERLVLQRALADRLEQQQTDRTELDTAEHLDALQRQRNELQAEAARPVYQRIQERRGAGNPLPEAVQRHLEEGLNHDLSKVRIHDDTEADRMAKGVNAVAFTAGTDIYFQSGKFNPNTQTGLELLAHEVTHTVQQSQGKVGKGIDPDSGLESQAREMGRKLAARPVRPAGKRKAKSDPPHFGSNHERRSFHKRVRAQAQKPRTTLRQALHAGTGRSLQRFGWNDIKKLASKGTKAVASRVNSARATVTQAARRVTQSVKKVARPAIRAAQRIVKRATATVRRAAKRASVKIRSVGRKISRYATKRLNPLKRLARRAVKGVRRIGRGIKRGATRLARRTAKTFRSARKAARAFTKRVGSRVKRSVRGVLRVARKGAGKAFNKARRFVKKQVGSRVSKALRAASRLTRRAKGAMSKARAMAQRLSRKVGMGVNAVKGAASKVKNAYNKVKNSPRFKAFMSRAKEVGIQAASIGASIVVGGAIIAGAAALTVGTGGLAGPALVGALFASGAAGGAAGKLVENTLRGKKNKFDGINVKTILRDGALGVALGPIGKVAGKVVGRGLGAAGRGLARVSNRVAPKLTARLTSTGSSVKAAAGRKLATVKNAFNNTGAGRTLNAVRSKASKGLERTGVRMSNAKNRALGTVRSKISNGANRVRARLGGVVRTKPRPTTGGMRGQTRPGLGQTGIRQARSTIRTTALRGQRRAGNAGRAGRPTAGRNRRPQGGSARRRPGGNTGSSVRSGRGPRSNRPQSASRGTRGPNRNTGPGRSDLTSIRLRNVANRYSRSLVGQLSRRGRLTQTSGSTAARPAMSNAGRPGPRGNAQTGGGQQPVRSQNASGGNGTRSNRPSGQQSSAGQGQRPASSGMKPSSSRNGGSKRTISSSRGATRKPVNQTRSVNSGTQSRPQRPRGLEETKGRLAKPSDRSAAAAKAERAARQAERQAKYEEYVREQFAKSKADGYRGTIEEQLADIRKNYRRTQLRDRDVHSFRYHMQAPTGRAARIDELTRRNYERLLREEIASRGEVYRYTLLKTVNNYYLNPTAPGIRRASYMTTERFTSNFQSMDRAQVAPQWGIHDVRLTIPKNALDGELIIPRPFGNDARIKVGWEPFTKAYPQYGRGGAWQFLGKTREFDPRWVAPLEQNYVGPFTARPALNDVPPGD